MTVSKLRGKKHTLRSVAARMKTGHTAIHRIENTKNPGIMTLIKYAEAAELPLSEVVAVYEKMYKENVQNS